MTGLTSVLDLDKNSLPRFDLILLDIMMPDVDGLQFCHEIRNQVDCPILFITAKTQEADIVQGLSMVRMITFANHLGLKNSKRVLQLT